MEIDKDETILACEIGTFCHSLFLCGSGTSPSPSPSEAGERSGVSNEWFLTLGFESNLAF